MDSTTPELRASRNIPKSKGGLSPSTLTIGHEIFKYELFRGPRLISQYSESETQPVRL